MEALKALLKDRELKKLCERMHAEPERFIENATRQLVADCKKDADVFDAMRRQIARAPFNE